MAAATPMGAYPMMMLVTRNIVSASDSQNTITGRPFSPIMPSATAKSMLKITICSTSPRAIASTIEVGMTCSRISSHVCGACGDRRRPEARQQHADARLEHVDQHQPDHERERRDGLEVDDGAQAHAADVLEMPGARDAGHERGEDQRRDDHLDQAQEDR